MKVLSKIVDKGIIVGYMVKDDKFDLPLCKDALYCEMFITQLIADGYKYYNHNADEIEDADGNVISDLPAVELSTLDEMEWFASQDMAASSMLNDVEAAQYYVYREEAAIQFKTEASYEINTREEFIAYLEQLKTAFYSVDYSTDNRPLNAFVNPQALFTLDELIETPEYCRYFDTIIKRHHMRDYSAWRSLINWLKEKGVLSTDTPSMAEFLSAYYAWGPEGVNAKCVGSEVKMNVDGVFMFAKDPLNASSPEANVHDNREPKVAIIDGKENLHFLKVHENTSQITDIKDFGRSRIIVGSNESLFQIRRLTNTGKKYTAVNRTFYSDISDRLYMTLITQSGFTYVYKVAHNKMRIGLAHSNNAASIYYSNDNFKICSIVKSVTIPIDNLASADDYYLWNLAILKSAQIMKRKTHPAPVRSTSEYLLKDGINPIAVVDIMAYSIKNHPQYDINRKYQLSDKEDDIRDALDFYLRDLPDYLLNAFCLTPEDLEDGVNSFLELADVDDLRDRRDAMMEQKINPGDFGFDETFKDYKNKYAKERAALNQVRAALGRQDKMYDAIDYYTKLKFVYDCLHGNISADNFGDGIIADIGASFGVSAECILSVIYAEYGNDVSRDVAEQAILDIENSDLINIDNIFRMRDRALKGYLADFGDYRENRACEDTWLWAYCTKVFREVSNAPVEKQRPYLMEIIVLDKGKHDLPTRRLMKTIVDAAIEKSNLDRTWFDTEGRPLYKRSELSCAMQSSDYMAAQLFFYILAGGVKTEPINGSYNIPLTVADDIKIDIEVPVEVYDFVKSFNVDVHRKYITVFDYCNYEYSPYTTKGTFRFCLVNADVDPWHVKPKKGYSIKSYSLLPNYYDFATLDGANGQGFYDSNAKTGAICVQPFKDLFKSKFITAGGDEEREEMFMWNDVVRDCKDPDLLYDFLQQGQNEYIFAYVKRWALERKKAAANGHKLISIPLKQDIVYGALASLYCDEIPATTPVYSDDVAVNDKACQQVTTVNRISWKDFDTATANLIEGPKAEIHEATVHDFSLIDVSEIRDILDGSYECPIRIVITGNYINVKSGTVIRVPATRLTADDINTFLNDGVLRRLGDNKYFIRAINGDYILEV